jgi:hypothetical protein
VLQPSFPTKEKGKKKEENISKSEEEEDDVGEKEKATRKKEEKPKSTSKKKLKAARLERNLMAKRLQNGKSPTITRARFTKCV